MNSRDALDDRLRSHLFSVRADLMTGVSFMIPFVTIGGFFLAVGRALGGTHGNAPVGSPAWFLTQIGIAGVALMVPILGAYIAYAIADRPGLAPGFILSYVIQQSVVVGAAGGVFDWQVAGDAGFLGALVAGLLAGGVARWLGERDVPDALRPMMPVLVVPVVTTAALAPLVIFGLGIPLALANEWLAVEIRTMGFAEAAVVGCVLGAMMAFDLGGPVNKVAYVFAVGLVPEGVYGPMAAVMIAGMTPPLGMAVATRLRPERFAETTENPTTLVLSGLSFVTEGAMSFATAAPLRVVPGMMLGSAVAGAASTTLGVTMPVPHGGVLVVPLSTRPFAFLGCLVLGAVVTAATVIGMSSRPDDTTSASQPHTRTDS